MDKDLKTWLSVYLKGLAMGAADSVPGVSGGTIAMITGIYEQLITSISSINYRTAHHTFKALVNIEIDKVLEEFREVDGAFLVVLLAGIITSLVVVLRFMHLMLSSYAVATYGFFFGLIAVSAVVLYRKIDLSPHTAKLTALTGFLFSFSLSGFAFSSLGHSLPVLFFSGFFAVSAMVLPGISGSLILLILGQYEFMTGILTKFTNSLLNTPSQGLEKIEGFLPITVFATGAVLGLATISRIVSKAFENHRNLAMAFLVSLIAGALRSPIIEASSALSESGGSWSTAFPRFAAPAFLGGILIYVLDRKAGLMD